MLRTTMMRSFLLAVALVPLCSARATGAAPRSAQAFMESVYDQFHGGMPDYTDKASEALFDPVLSHLQERANALSEAAQEDDDDANDLCECQDLDHPHWKITTSAEIAGKAQSVVLFSDQGKTIKLRFWLIKTAAGWRITDFQLLDDGFAKKGGRTKIEPTHKQQLLSLIAEYRKHPPKPADPSG